MDTLSSPLPAPAEVRAAAVGEPARSSGHTKLPSPLGRDATAVFRDTSRDRGVVATLGPAPAEALAAAIGAVDAAPRRAAPLGSVDFATGEADGVRCRADHGRPTKYLLIGRDDYAAGFRAGYFRVVAPRTAAAILPAGTSRRDRHAAIAPSDPIPHGRHGADAAARAHASRRAGCGGIHGIGCHRGAEEHSMVHQPTAPAGTPASAQQEPALATDRCIDRIAPGATRLAVAQAIGIAAGSGGHVAVMRVRICPAGTAQADDAERARLAAALAGRIACGKDDCGPLPDGAWGFAVVLGAVGDRLSALTRANRMVAALDVPMRPDGGAPAFAAAIGIGLFPEDGADADELLTSAAHALSDLCRGRQGAAGFRFRCAGCEIARRSPGIAAARAHAARDP